MAAAAGHSPAGAAAHASLAHAPLATASHARAITEASSQLSRFHLETLTVTGNKALQLQTVNLSVGNKQLLCDAELSLMPGVRYGLTGRWVVSQLCSSHRGLWPL
jgi:hypothetical protein